MENQYIKEPKVLIIDDTPEEIHIIASILKEENYKVSVLTDSRDVFEVLDSIKINLILLDLVMPVISGIELCRRIKCEPRYNSIPIIFLTAISDSNSIVDAFSAGAQDYVSKPVNPRELLARVGVHLQLKFKTERLEKAYEDIESFNHMVCHDLKSPLWAIKSLVGFLNEECLKGSTVEAKHFLLRLNEKATESISLIEKLSELSKVSSEPLVKEKIRIRDLFIEVLNILVSENKNRSVEFTVPDLPEVLGDRLLIRQVIFNVLSNAFKYTSRSLYAKIDITCSIDKNEYIFCVEDNGAGFNMDYSNKLFHMFQRLHSKKEFEGTGTGLAIAKKIIERHNGRIWLKSEEEKGTRVYFTLPV